MKLYEMFILHSIHFLGVVILVGLILSAAGCSPEDEDEKADYGEEISFQKVQETLLSSLKGSNPLSMKVGDMVLLEQNQKVETSVPQRTNLVKEIITGREEASEGIIYRILLEETKYQGNEPETFQREIQEAYELPSAVSSFGEFSYPGYELAIPMDQVVQNSLKMLAPKPVKVTFHKLQTSKKTQSAPPDVALRPGCEGLMDCRVNGTQVKFNQVVWFDDGHAEMIKMSYFVSPEVPYRAQILENCAQFLYRVETNTYFVSQCTFVRDFGHLSP